MTTYGCEIMITWEPSTTVIVAPARLAMARMTSMRELSASALAWIQPPDDG